MQTMALPSPQWPWASTCTPDTFWKTIHIQFLNPLSCFYLISDYFFLLLKSYKQLHWSINIACNKVKKAIIL